MSNDPINPGRLADIHEIRRRNLRLLIDEYAGGHLYRFVEWTLHGSMSYKSLQHVTGPGRKRNLGYMLARRIEVQLHLQRGWMDQNRSGIAHTVTVPGGRSERVVHLAESIESLTPRIRVVVEKLVAVLKQGVWKRGAP
jgi:hypothetical protein